MRLLALWAQNEEALQMQYNLAGCNTEKLLRMRERPRVLADFQNAISLHRYFSSAVDGPVHRSPLIR
jgi:hypothetical protein